MTALVILGILACIIVVVLTACYMNIKQLRNKALLELCQNQKAVIGKVYKEALDYGYPADPLSYTVVNTINEARNKESI